MGYKTEKFAYSIGSADDFVQHLRILEAKNNLSNLSNFGSTNSGGRYLLVAKGSTPVIDFRHFFAAMSQRLSGGVTEKFWSVKFKNTFRSESGVLLLGVVNEISQCIDETAKLKLESCFAFEDLASNRLGVEFAEMVIRYQSNNAKINHGDLLKIFLANLDPLPASRLADIKVNIAKSVLLELVGQTFQMLSNSVFPKAY